VWVRNPRHWWASPDGTTIAGAELELSGLRSGTWSLRWIDPFSGAVVSSDQLVSRDGTLRATVPPFARELAGRAEWLSDTAPGVAVPAFTG
jgi:hypothetical protein